jgi:aminoglycoside 6'-N-acetyltransferase I
MTIAPVTLRAAGPADLAAAVPLAVAFYAEDGFDTGEHVPHSNLSALLASPAARVAVVQSEARLLGFVGHLFGYYLAHGFLDEGRRLISRPL